MFLGKKLYSHSALFLQQVYNYMGSSKLNAGGNPAVANWLKICPGLNANEIQIPYDKYHKVSSYW